MMTAKSLLSVAVHGGPRCCKRNTFLSITEAVKFLEENLQLTMTINKNIKCHYSALNEEYLKASCPFHIQEAKFLDRIH